MWAALGGFALKMLGSRARAAVICDLVTRAHFLPCLPSASQHMSDAAAGAGEHGSRKPRRRRGGGKRHASLASARAPSHARNARQARQDGGGGARRRRRATRRRRRRKRRRWRRRRRSGRRRAHALARRRGAASPGRSLRLERLHYALPRCAHRPARPLRSRAPVLGSAAPIFSPPTSTPHGARWAGGLEGELPLGVDAFGSNLCAPPPLLPSYPS